MLGPGAWGGSPAPTPAGDVDTKLDLPDPSVTAPPQPAQGTSGDPALMLGDPSDLRLRDPDQTLKLDLDE